MHDRNSVITSEAFPYCQLEETLTKIRIATIILYISLLCLDYLLCIPNRMNMFTICTITILSKHAPASALVYLEISRYWDKFNG